MRHAESGQLDLPLEFRVREAVGHAHLELRGRLVSYTVKRSARRRSLSIVIDEQGLRVGAPWEASEQAIERLLRKHAAWVLRKLEDWQSRRPAPRQWRSGEPLMFMGQTLRIELVCAREPTRLEGGALLIGTVTTERSEVCRAALEWLHAEALACYRERVEHFRRLLDIDAAPHVALSSARTRWGSCHASGRIRVNWRLIQMPLRLIDYVVAHEVAHLVEMNHSARFWRTVARVVPDYPERRAEVRREGHRYLLL
jgi:predicted metal-dependent hydrolase